MIYVDRKDLYCFEGLSEYLDLEIHEIKTKNLTNYQMGGNLIAGDKVFVNRMEYDTIPEKEGFFEAHEKYLDLHLLLEGEETICVSHIYSMKETRRDEESDFVGYEGETQARCLMNPDKVLVAFPCDAHKVKVMGRESSHVKKLVFKVKYRK